MRRRVFLGAATALAGCAAPRGQPFPADMGPPTDHVLLARFAWHTEVLVPGQRGAHDSWGFGARDFFTSPRPGLNEFLLALTSGPAAIVVTPRQPPADTLTLPVSTAGLRAIRGFLADELLRDAAGRPVEIGPGFAPGAVFFEARRPYSLAYTCNSWTMDALAAAGLPVRSRGVLTAADALAEARRAAVTPSRSGAGA